MRNLSKNSRRERFFCSCNRQKDSQEGRICTLQHNAPGFASFFVALPSCTPLKWTQIYQQNKEREREMKHVFKGVFRPIEWERKIGTCTEQRNKEHRVLNFFYNDGGIECLCSQHLAVSVFFKVEMFLWNFWDRLKCFQVQFRQEK
jgi:hypothetical protein